MVRLFFLLHLLFPQLLLLPCLHHLSKILLRVLPLHLFISLFILPWIPPQSLFLIPILTLTLYPLFPPMLLWTDPLFSSSYTLATSLPSSLSLSHPIYRPLPIYASPRTTNSSMESIPCLYSSVLSTNTLSMSHHGGLSTMVSSVSSRPIPSGSRRKVTRSWPRNWLRSWPRDNTFYTTRRQCPRPAIPCSSLSSNTVLFPLLSSWANPSSYHYSDDPMNLTFKPRTNLQALGGSPFNPLFKSDSSHPHIYSPMVTFNEPSENVRGMFSFVHSCQFSPGANNKLLSSLVKR